MDGVELVCVHPLVHLIDSVVEPSLRPAIYIGGGIDSAVLLYHLAKKSEETIYSYSFAFPELGYDETKEAERVAEHFGTKHSTVKIVSLLKKTREILHLLPSPRFSVWVYWSAERVYADGRSNIYIGEGGDEHFGGYWYKSRKPYIEYWAGLYVYGIETYRMIHNLFGLKLQFPYLSLDIAQTRQYFDENHEKRFLREAYAGILPSFVVEKRKRPAGPDQALLWEKELSKEFPDVTGPLSNEKIRWYWNVWVMQEWLKSWAFIK